MEVMFTQGGPLNTEWLECERHSFLQTPWKHFPHAFIYKTITACSGIQDIFTVSKENLTAAEYGKHTSNVNHSTQSVYLI